MSEVNRYNQGFYKFGLMEQCNDGKYILAEDYNILNQSLQEAMQGEIASRKELLDLRYLAASRTKELTDKLKLARFYNRLFIASYLFILLFTLVGKPF
jgi:hypothetical protein